MRPIKLLSLFTLLSLALVLAYCGTVRLAAERESAPAPVRHEAQTAVDAQDPRFEATVLTHTFMQALSNTATGDFYHPAYSYPDLEIDKKYSHALTFQMTPFLPPRRDVVPGNGPLILFSDDFDVIVFSPLDHFYVSLIDFRDGKIRYGIEGDVKKIYGGFVHRFLLVKGKGISATIAYWGEQMRASTGRARVDRYADIGSSYLGYWTDNGAAYYYGTAPDMNYEETLLAVKADADARRIPFRYFQIDSWWYYKKPGPSWVGGMVRWEPRPDVFPHGLTAFQQKLGLPLIAHNRWFDLENDYVGQYEFVNGERMAIPLRRDVFDHFVSDAKKWGIFTYEQDWLMPQYWGAKWLRNDVDHAEQWIKNMDDAVADQGLTMQLCMAGAANLMDAINRRSWTTIRTTIDYRQRYSKESYWPQFHTVNMLAWAVGLLPFKDNFRCAEKYGEAEALISTLSAGMVGPSDEIGKTDPILLARTCRADGLLLKPDRPAFPIDAMFLEHERPYIAQTVSQREGVGAWTYLAAYHLSRMHPQRRFVDRLWLRGSYDFRDPRRFFVFPDRVKDWRVSLSRDLGVQGPVVAYNWKTSEAKIAPDTFDLPVIDDLYGFDYLVLAPIFANGLALIGETGKFVTLADKRFEQVEVLDDGIRVRLRGVPGECVELRLYDVESQALPPAIKIILGDDGTAETTLRRHLAEN